MRISEMYLILIENLPFGEAIQYYTTYRQSRGIGSDADALFTEESRISRIESEYRKEFYGEGQMFFFYKKHNYTSFPWPGGFSLPNGLSDYVLPKPQKQRQFEN